MVDLYISSKEHNNISLQLRQEEQVIDTVDFSFDKNLDTLLIESIDKFLKRNKIDQSSLYSVSVDPGIDKNSSLYKIVKTFQAALGSLRE